MRRGIGEFIQPPGGRWPSNVILEHRPECKCVGSKKVKGIGGDVSGKEASSPQWGGRTRVPFSRHADKDGLEEVPAWECHEDCPVKALDDQSGVLTSGGKQGNIYTTDKKGLVFPGLHRVTSPLISDTGGASRFFKQIKRCE